MRLIFGWVGVGCWVEDMGIDGGGEWVVGDWMVGSGGDFEKFSGWIRHGFVFGDLGIGGYQGGWVLGEGMVWILEED